MKRTFAIMALGIMLGALSQEARALDVEATIPVTQSYDRISNTAGVDIIYTQGSRHTVKAVGTSQDVDKVKVKVENGKLIIYAKTVTRKFGDVTVNTTNFQKDVKVRITSPELHAVDILGSGDFSANTIKTDRLSLNVTGSGDIDIKKVATEDLTAKIAGSGEIDIDNVAAKSGKALFSIAGSGDIDARVSGCHSVTCNVAGSGEITVKGKTVNYSSSVAGSGSIDRKELVVTGSCSESNTTTTTSRNRTINTVNGINPMP